MPREWGSRACCDVVNRGAAAWNGKVYVGTIDGRLLALDAATGALAWNADTLVRRDVAYTITGAPRVVKGKVIIGNGGAEYGVRGYVSAYDAATGALAWRFFTRSRRSRARLRERDDGRGRRGRGTASGGGSAAAAPSGIRWPTTRSSISFISAPATARRGTRVCAAPAAATICSCRRSSRCGPTTGAYVWHYQTTPGESWDYTATQPIVVADLTLDGAPRRVVMQAPKNGFFYVLDAATGKLISADKFAAVNWASGVDLATGRPIENPAARYDVTGSRWPCNRRRAAHTTGIRWRSARRQASCISRPATTRSSMRLIATSIRTPAFRTWG